MPHPQPNNERVRLGREREGGEKSKKVNQQQHINLCIGSEICAKSKVTKDDENNSTNTTEQRQQQQQQIKAS